MNKDLDPTQELPPTEVVEEVKNADEEVEEDRSAFNCGTCRGEGLIWHEGAKRHERCPSCGGTGKVN